MYVMKLFVKLIVRLVYVTGRYISFSIFSLWFYYIFLKAIV